MIKYYDTEAAYEADSKSAFESQVSLIGASNECRYDGRNVVVGLRSARTGSIAVLDGLHALHFIAPETFTSSGFMSNYEIVGVVAIGVDHPDFRGKVGIINKTFSSKVMFERWFVKLTGYTLDGTDRTGTLVVREASDSWNANHEYVISYNATTAEALVSQLNTYFKANEPFITQDWVAVLQEDGSVVLNYKYTNWQQAFYNGAKAGFSVSVVTAQEWNVTSQMYRMNGQRSGEGTITNWLRALAYYRSDNSDTSYNPSVDVKTKKIVYPICLPGYLGTSQYQSDHCAYLRGIYGEGEEGWLKFMASFLPVRPLEYDIYDESRYGTEKKNTYYLAGLTYRGQDGTEKYASPAARLAAETGYDHDLLKMGEWVMPGIDHVFSIVSPLKYPAVNDRNADAVNTALYAIGAPALGNNSSVWSCSRYGSSGGWAAYGLNGFAGSNGLYSRNLCVPLVLLDVTAEGVA